jgi:hypothetical protein
MLLSDDASFQRFISNINASTYSMTSGKGGAKIHVPLKSAKINFARQTLVVLVSRLPFETFGLDMERGAGGSLIGHVVFKERRMHAAPAGLGSFSAFLFDKGDDAGGPMQVKLSGVPGLALGLLAAEVACSVRDITQPSAFLGLSEKAETTCVCALRPAAWLSRSVQAGSAATDAEDRAASAPDQGARIVRWGDVASLAPLQESATVDIAAVEHRCIAKRRRGRSGAWRQSRLVARRKRGVARAQRRSAAEDE